MPETQFQSDFAATPARGLIAVGSRQIALSLVWHPRARRYLLRLRPDGTARVTVPRRGSVRAAWEFVQRNLSWLEQQLGRLPSLSPHSGAWSVGSEFLYRGEHVRIQAAGPGRICVGSEEIRVADPAGDLRPEIEVHLRRLAAAELPARLLELAERHGLEVRRITIRNQRTRWGSCSRRATISLNWRLVQTPGFVRDYICLHELAHLLEMNHSKRFWRHVERMCPDYRVAERWLKEHPGLLH